MLIHTQRLRLITCEEKHLAAIDRDPRSLGAILNVVVPEQWPEHPQAYSQAMSLLKKQPLLPYSGWWLYLFVHPVLKTLVGCGGFKGAPDADGVVEVGCEIAPQYRREGFAAEGLRGLISYAFTRPGVGAVDAYSMPKTGPQAQLAKKVGMKRNGEATDPIAGRVWHWRITRRAYLNRALAARVA
jgi:RimJ/RimL family protein N-acetyltransferase